ncbi:hypothetical protein L596_029215 [Steinernema carpocapsae]|uniref:ShKT domain-containing protein n=1 Tax=Steinernema carpocapsae TaxID=34508 RepID=A0A4U5LTZ2_STECR|nr:hypothetical protein L596_029215 [Steinernema carpocapsae]
MFGKVLFYLAALDLLAQSVQSAQSSTTAAGSTVQTTTQVPRCSDNYGNLKPEALSCSNQFGDTECNVIFPEAPVASPAYRSPKCYQLPEVALKCAKRCAICCEDPNYSCGDGKSIYPIN